MRDYVLFQMWGPFRQSLIDGHMFYVEQATKRLLSQFNNIEKEADKASDDWLESRSQYFDPDRHDPGDFYESATEAGIEFYQLLSDMRDRTRLSVVAGMFHEWDKQLREWLAREIRHWNHGDYVAREIWRADFEKVADLLESLDRGVGGKQYFKTLDACRLVVNVYKHGAGVSLNDLKQRYPEYLANPLKHAGGSWPGMEYLDHTHLIVSDVQLQRFADAIVEFWQGMPENIYDSQVTTLPSWFEKALQKP